MDNSSFSQPDAGCGYMPIVTLAMGVADMMAASPKSIKLLLKQSQPQLAV